MLNVLGSGIPRLLAGSSMHDQWKYFNSSHALLRDLTFPERKLKPDGIRHISGDACGQLIS